MDNLLNLQDLLEHELEDLHSAEEQIAAALPKMIKAANDSTLKKAFSNHLEITHKHLARLEAIKEFMDSLQPKAEEKKSILARFFGATSKCKGMEGLIQEGEKMMGGKMDPKVKDAALIAAAQKIEHYEISGYGTAKAFANELGLTKVAQLLETTLKEEYEADEELTSLALGKVNAKAKKLTQKAPSKKGNMKAPAKKTVPGKKVATAKKTTIKTVAKKIVKPNASSKQKTSPK